MNALEPSLAAALVSRGVQIEVGPFLVHVHSALPGVRDYIERFYSTFPIRDLQEGHFSLSIEPGQGVHRWLRPQAIAVVNGTKPFFPLPQSLAGPVFEWALNWCTGRIAHRWVVVHAAVVERGGRAMIFPATPGAGKSTLCAALTYAGWRYFSDEFALLDPSTGLVWPLPRPISLKDAAIEVIRGRHPDVVYGPEGTNVEDERFVHARVPESSIRRAGDPAKPAWVINPAYRPGVRTAIDPLARAHALVRLAGQSFNYNYLGTAGYQALARTIEDAQCFTLEYSDLDDVIAQLERLTDA
jgi:HprK-related kinase A